MRTRIVCAVRGPGVSFPGHGPLLRDIDFIWREGETWAVVGPNGSGKSVLLRLLDGSLFDPRMKISYGFRGRRGGEPCERVEIVSLQRQQEVLASFDAYAQMRWNSSDNEATPTLLDWLDQDAIEGVLPYEVVHRAPSAVAAFARRRGQTLQALGLAPLAKSNLPSLSNGEMRRAFLAYALLREPAVLALDSPFTGLDAPSLRIVSDLLARLAREGRTRIILATATVAEIPPFATHVLELGADGGIVRQGPVDRAARRASSRGKPFYRSGARTFRIEHDEPPDTSAKPLVELRDVCVRYGEETIFEHLSWTIRKGEKWLLAGPNGSGKTTLLALMQGDHLQAYSNDIRVFGRRRGTGDSIWDIKRKVGSVSPELHATVDGRQTLLQVVLSGFEDAPYDRSSGGRRQLAAAKKALADVGLADRMETPFGAVSSGQQRLALLARAVVKKPPFLLFDEPCQNLDDANVARFLDATDRLCSDPATTLVYVTHRADCVPSCLRHRFLCARRR